MAVQGVGGRRGRLCGTGQVPSLSALQTPDLENQGLGQMLSTASEGHGISATQFSFLGENYSFLTSVTVHQSSSRVTDLLKVKCHSQSSPPPPYLQAVLTVLGTEFWGRKMSFTAPEMNKMPPSLPHEGSQSRGEGGAVRLLQQPASQGRKGIFKCNNLEAQHICSWRAHSTARQTRHDGSQSLTGCQVLQMMELKIARYR